MVFAGVLPRDPSLSKTTQFTGFGNPETADWQMSKVLGPGFKWTSPHRSRIVQKTIAGPRFVDTGIATALDRHPGHWRIRCTGSTNPAGGRRQGFQASLQAESHTYKQNASFPTFVYPAEKTGTAPK